MASHRSAPSIHTTTKVCLLFSILLVGMAGMASAQLSSTFYDKSCPKALPTIKSAIVSAVSKEARMGASLLRLHFHDCFVQASHLISHFRLIFFFLNSSISYLQMSACVVCVRVSACS